MGRKKPSDAGDYPPLRAAMVLSTQGMQEPSEVKRIDTRAVFLAMAQVCLYLRRFLIVGQWREPRPADHKRIAATESLRRRRWWKVR